MGTVCNPPTLSVNVTELVILPVVVGLTVTTTEQVPPWGSKTAFRTQVPDPGPVGIANGVPAVVKAGATETVVEVVPPFIK